MAETGPPRFRQKDENRLVTSSPMRCLRPVLKSESRHLASYNNQGGRFEPAHAGGHGRKKVKIVLAIFMMVYILGLVDSGWLIVERAATVAVLRTLLTGGVRPAAGGTPVQWHRRCSLT